LFSIHSSCLVSLKTKLWYLWESENSSDPNIIDHLNACHTPSTSGKKRNNYSFLPHHSIEQHYNWQSPRLKSKCSATQKSSSGGLKYYDRIQELAKTYADQQSPEIKELVSQIESLGKEERDISSALEPDDSIFFALPL
jgi:hypothetical protein